MHKDVLPSMTGWRLRAQSLEHGAFWQHLPSLVKSARCGDSAWRKAEENHSMAAAPPGRPPHSSSPPRQRAPAPQPCPPPPSPGCKAAPKSRAVARAAPAPGLLPDWQGSTAWAAVGREKGHGEVGCPIVTPAPVTEGCRHRLQPPRHPAGLHPTRGRGRPWAFWGAGPSPPLPTRRPKE